MEAWSKLNSSGEAEPLKVSPLLMDFATACSKPHVRRAALCTYISNVLSLVNGIADLELIVVYEIGTSQYSAPQPKRLDYIFFALVSNH